MFWFWYRWHLHLHLGIDDKTTCNLKTRHSKKNPTRHSKQVCLAVWFFLGGELREGRAGSLLTAGLAHTSCISIDPPPFSLLPQHPIFSGCPGLPSALVQVWAISTWVVPSPHPSGLVSRMNGSGNSCHLESAVYLYWTPVFLCMERGWYNIYPTEHLRGINDLVLVMSLLYRALGMRTAS